MKYIANLCQLTATICSCCCYLSCFLYNHLFLCPLPPSKTTSVYKRTDRHLLHAAHFDRSGCNWLCTIDPHGSWNVSCPLPYPSSPASWTLLSPLSVQDSRNISSNGRHHHKLLSSLGNNKKEYYTSIQMCHWCSFKTSITRNCHCLKARSYQLQCYDFLSFKNSRYLHETTSLYYSIPSINYWCEKLTIRKGNTVLKQYLCPLIPLLKKTLWRIPYSTWDFGSLIKSS